MKHFTLPIAFIFFMLSARPSSAQDLTNFAPPKLFIAKDTPNDDGSTISLTWLASESESETDVDYVIFISPDKNGPWIPLPKRVSAKLNYKSDDPGIYDYKDENEYFHFVKVSRRGAYTPDDEQELQAEFIKTSRIIEITEKARNIRVRLDELNKKKEVVAWQKRKESGDAVRARYDRAVRLIELIEDAKSILPKFLKLSKNKYVLAWEKDHADRAAEDARKEYNRIARLVRLLDKAKEDTLKLSELSKNKYVKRWKEQTQIEGKSAVVVRYANITKLIDIIETAKQHAERLSKFSKDKSEKGRALTHLLEAKLTKLEKKYLELEPKKSKLPRDVRELKEEYKRVKRERRELKPVMDMLALETQIQEAEREYPKLNREKNALPHNVTNLKREYKRGNRELKRLKLLVEKFDVEARLAAIEKKYLTLLPERNALPRNVKKLREDAIEFRHEEKRLKPIIEELSLKDNLSRLEQRYATLQPGKSLPVEISKLRKEHYASQERLWKVEAKLKKAREKYDDAIYYFRLGVVPSGDTKTPEPFEGIIASASAKGNIFNKAKTNNFSIMIIYSIIVLAFIRLARRNPNLFLRKISGLEAVEDALGRATEMGRPVMFIHGLASMSSISTVASVNILGRIARRIAEYDARVKVVNVDPIVMAVSQEVVKEAYTEAGRPDAFNEDDIFLVASDQFPYALAVSGIMMRDRPAANFFMGYFYAESLILAETGSVTGAIQIAGTDSYTQIPFFITTCDYTLIGEELYAASAYLSREPLLLGSLRGQDVGKAFILLLLVVGTSLATFGISYLTHLFQAY